MKRTILSGVLVLATSAGGLGAQATATELEFAGEGGFELAGTLLVPERGEEVKKLPGILLLPGSGPTDRDGNQPPLYQTDLLKEIAERLASEGVASLRFDKRAVPAYEEAWPRGTPEELGAFFSYENFIADALAAYRTLAAREEIDPGRVAILGHSVGGLYALQVAHDLARADDTPAGLVLLATPARTFDVLIREQITYQMQRGGATEEALGELMAVVDAALAAVREDTPLPEDLPLPLRPLFNPTTVPLLRSYMTTDPLALARALPCPVLVIQGESDVQISSERDTPLLRNALESRPRGATRVATLPLVSHNLKTVEEESDLGMSGPVDPRVMTALMQWVAATLQG
jgi:pimeloyl-ACP methyl ester carboxylesterase